MDDAKGVKRRGRPPKRVDSDGEARNDSVGSETDANATGQGSDGKVVKYSTIEVAAKKAELAEGPHGRRIVKVFHAEDNHPDLWMGVFGCAPVESGKDGYQFSDGETVTL